MPGSIPYFEPQKPVIPVADQTPAHLVAQMGNAGLAGFIQMHGQAQRAQLEEKSLQQHALLQEQEFGIAREKLAQEFQLKSEELGIHKNLYDAEAEAYRATAHAKGMEYSTGVLTAAGKRVSDAHAVAEFNTDAAPLMNDANPRNPAKFYADYQRLEDKWRFTQVPYVKDGLRKLKFTTEQQTVPLKIGGRLDDTGKLIGGEMKQVPVGQIVERLSDPQQQDATLELLRQNGLATRTTEVPSFIQRWIKGEHTTRTTTQLSPALKPYAQMGRGVDWSRGKARVDTPGAAVAGAESANNAADLPAFEPTESEKILQDARDHIAKGAKREAVAARLQEMGIDPSQL